MKDIGMIGEDKALAEEEDDDEDTNDEAKRFKRDHETSGEQDGRR
jgi:hypothetical protein